MTEHHAPRGRRLLAVLLSAMLTTGGVATMMATAPTAQAATIAKGATLVTTDAVNLRKGAGTDHSVVTVVPKGNQVTATAKSTGSWVAVRTSSGKTGYMSTDYLKTTASKTKAAETLIKYTTTDKVNYRTSPSTSGKVVKTLNKGTTVQIVSGYSKKANGYTWYKMKSGGKYYYLVSSYLKKASTTASPTSVKLNKTSASVTAGKTLKLTATVSPSNAANKKVTYSSSNTAVAKVNSSGTVTGVKAGTATITVKTSNGKKATCKVTVTKAETLVKYTTTDKVNYRTSPSTSGKVVKTLNKGTTVQIVSGYSKKANGYTWYKMKSGSKYYYIATTYLKKVVEPTSVKLSKTSASVTAGKTLKLTATVSPSNATNKSVTYSSSNTAVAKVNSSGTVTGVKAGTATITVKTSNGKTATCKVTVTKATTTTQETLVQYTTTTGVNYRKEPSLKGALVGTLSTGTVVDVVKGYAKDADGYTWLKIKDGNNYYYLASNYVKEGISASQTTQLAQGKSMYLATYSGGTWSSSNKDIATVNGGFVQGVKQGTATITWSNGASRRTWSIQVTAGEPIKFAYTTPNVVLKGKQATFVAITDTSKNSVKFEVNGKSVVVTNYTTETAPAKNGFAASSCRIWKYTTTMNTPGSYTAKVYSSAKSDGSGMSSGYKTAEAFVVSSTTDTQSSAEKRRISDKGLEVIAHWEGYAPAIYLDPLTSSPVPTVGYGFTVSQGGTFYNNLTQPEAWALLVEAVNGNYTTQCNNFIVNNNIKANQQAFDAMVSFSYNCGAGYWNGSGAFGLRTFLLNAVNPASVQDKIKAGTEVQGTLEYSTVLRKTKSYTDAAAVTAPSGTSVQITEATWDANTESAWYKVTCTVSDKKYDAYVPAPYVRITSHSFQKDMNYMDAHTFGSELLEWHHAGGQCYAGLLYRRLAEAKIFSFGNYRAPWDERTKNTHGYTLPDCVANRNWITN